MFLIRIKTIHFVFIGNDSCKLVIEVDTYGVLILFLHLLFYISVLVQPLTLIILCANDVIIAHIYLEGIFVIELNSFIYLPVLTHLLSFSVFSN